MAFSPRAQKAITLLGSTGSIGTHALEVIKHTEEAYRIEALTAHHNVTLLAKQAEETQANIAVIGEKRLLPELQNLLSHTSIKAYSGEEVIADIASHPVFLLINAIVGAAGLTPTIHALKQGTRIALANKESLVCAGNILLNEAKKHHTEIIPIDSEHNAIFQLWESHNLTKLKKIILTASGGPFRCATQQEMVNATPEQAIAHPNWNMGAKISVDSATMMNKALELIEAHYLFALPESQIDIIIHPESVIHGLIEYDDGSTLAQLGIPDMRTPISTALRWPNRTKTAVPPLNLASWKQLTFYPPDHQKFPALQLARHTLQSKNSAPILFNTANEIAVEAFLNNRIGFTDIIMLVEELLQQHTASDLTSIDEVKKYIVEVQISAKEWIKKHQFKKNS